MWWQVSPVLFFLLRLGLMQILDKRQVMILYYKYNINKYYHKTGSNLAETPKRIPNLWNGWNTKLSNKSEFSNLVYNSGSIKKRQSKYWSFSVFHWCLTDPRDHLLIVTYLWYFSTFHFLFLSYSLPLPSLIHVLIQYLLSAY